MQEENQVGQDIHHIWSCPGCWALDFPHIISSPTIPKGAAVPAAPVSLFCFDRCAKQGADTSALPVLVARAKRRSPEVARNIRKNAPLLYKVW